MPEPGSGPLSTAIDALAASALEQLGARTTISDEDITLVDAEAGIYGEVTTDVVKTLVAALRVGGLLTDPVYSAKALSALPRIVERGLVNDSGTVFIHTGGQPALFANQLSEDLLTRLRMSAATSAPSQGGRDA